MRRIAFLLWTIVACNPDARTPTDAKPEASTTPSATASAAPTGSMKLPGPMTASPALDVAITDLGGGRFEISNTGPIPVQLTTRTTIEKQEGTAWRSLDDRLDLGHGYRLVEQCEGIGTWSAPACVDLAPGAKLAPVPWSGFNCSAQCNGTCRANSFEGPGTFRLVVGACGGGATVTSPTFELPDISAGANVDRFGLATDVATATASRLELPSAAGFDASQAASPDRAAGFAMRAGTDHAIDRATLDDFLAWLRAEKGFDDQTQKRCAVRNLVGVRLTRHPRTTARTPVTEIAEIAMDFACNKIIVAFGDGTRRKADGALFDASRPTMLALAKRMFPADAEIAKLK